MTEILTLIADDGSSRDVFAGLRSIGQQEFYQASATDFRPSLKFVLADYLDYANEALVEHEGQRYRVLRTYRTGMALELVVERAPAEDGGVYG